MITPEIKQKVLEGALIFTSGCYSSLRLQKEIINNYSIKMNRIFQSNLPITILMAEMKKIKRQAKMISRASPIPGFICGFLLVGALRHIQNQINSEKTYE